MTLAWIQVGFGEGAPDNHAFLRRIGHIMGSEGHGYLGLSRSGPPSCNLAFLPRIRPQKFTAGSRYRRLSGNGPPPCNRTPFQHDPRVQIHDERPTTLQFRRIGTRQSDRPAPARPTIIPTPGTGAIVSQETSWRYPPGGNQLFTLYHSLELALPNIYADGYPVVPRAQLHRSPPGSNRLRAAQGPSPAIRELET